MNLSKIYFSLMVVILISASSLIFLFKNAITNFAQSITLVPSNSLKTVQYFEAQDFENQWVKVKLPVKYVFNNGKYLFISSMINPHHRHMLVDQSDKELLKQFFTVKILNKDLPKFDKNIQQNIKDKTLVVEGKVTYYQGDPHIEVSDPKNLSIID